MGSPSPSGGKGTGGNGKGSLKVSRIALRTGGIRCKKAYIALSSVAERSFPFLNLVEMLYQPST